MMLHVFLPLCSTPAGASQGREMGTVPPHPIAAAAQGAVAVLCCRDTLLAAVCSVSCQDPQGSQQGVEIREFFPQFCILGLV